MSDRQVSGIIKLNGSPLQTQVRVMRAADGELVATGNSNAAGRYFIPGLENESVFVQALPPVGYRPLMHGAVTPYLQPTISQPHGATNNETYTASITVDGGDLTLTAPFKWAIAGGKLPKGLHLGSSTTDTCPITGVPDDTVGYYNVLIQVEDANGVVVQQVVEIGLGNIVSLLHGNGPNNSTVINDETGRLWSRFGNIKIVENNSALGGAEIFAGGSGDYIQTPQTEDFRLSQAIDATIEFIITPTVRKRGEILSARNDIGGTKGFEISYHHPSAQNGLIFSSWSGTGVNNSIIAAGCVNFGERNAVRISLRSGKVSIYVNGFLVGAADFSGVLTASPISICRTSTGNSTTQDFAGMIDELKWIKGAALYNANNADVPFLESDFPIAPLLISITGSLPAATANTAYSSTVDLAITGTSAPFTVSVIDGALPGGWTAIVSGNYVEVTGAGVPAGDYYFTLEVADDDDNTAQIPLFLQVNP